MSTYTQEQETEIVKDALFLTKTIELEEEKLVYVENEKFRSQPVAPVHQKLVVPHIEPQIPAPPKTNYNYKDFYQENKKTIRDGIFFGGTISVIKLAKDFSNKRKEINESLAHSPEYLKAVEEAKQKAIEKQNRVNKEIAEKQARIDAQYATDLDNYNNVLIPNYKKDLEIFNGIKQKKIDMLREDIELNRETLEVLYQETKIISLTYRDIETLKWLYNDMSTSDHDIRYATELFDRQRQLDATLTIGKSVSNEINNLEASMTENIYAVFCAIEDGNDELAKTRRNENISNTISIIQRHNLNRIIKKYTK